MKKYWKMIVTAAIAVLSIGTFYIHSAVSAVDLPEFVIEKQKGDASLVKSVVVQGFYDQGPIHKRLHITTTGSVNDNETSSFLDGLFGHHPPKISHLIEKHRQFMRGKGEFIRYFYEGEYFLAYANVTYQTTALSPRDFKISISILDKREKDSTSYELSIPNQSKFDNIFVYDVQMMNGKLKIITKNYTARVSNDGERASGIHVYTIDIAAKKLISDQTIISSPKKNHNGFLDIEFINESNPKQTHRYVVFRKVTMTRAELNNGQSVHEAVEMERSSTLIAYNLKTQEKKKITLPRELKGKVSTQEEAFLIKAFDGSSLYFMERNKNEVNITPYNLESEKTGEKIRVQFSNVKEGAWHPIVKIKNGNLYTLSTFQEKKSSAILKVIDIKSGETHYKGEVVEKSPDTSENKYELSLFRMTVR